MSPAEWDAFMARLERALDERIAARVEARLNEMRPVGRRWSRRRMAVVASAAAAAAVFIFALSAGTSSSGPDLEWQRTDGARLPRAVEIGRPIPPEPRAPPAPPAKPVPPVKPAPPQRP